MAGGPMAARVVLVLVLGWWSGPVRPQRAGAGAGGLLGQRVLASELAGLPEGVLVGHTCKDRQGRVNRHRRCHPRSEQEGCPLLRCTVGAARHSEETAMGMPTVPEAQGTRGHLLESVLRLSPAAHVLPPTCSPHADSRACAQSLPAPNAATSHSGVAWRPVPVPPTSTCENPRHCPPAKTHGTGVSYAGRRPTRESPPTPQPNSSGLLSREARGRGKQF